MTTFMDWIPLLATLAAVAALSGAALVALFPLAVIRPIEPVARVRWLFVLSQFPAALAVLVLAVAFAPSTLDALFGVADHCGVHGGHHFHLCFLHGAPPGPAALMAVSSLLALVVVRWLAEARLQVVSHRWLTGLRRVARREAGGGWVLPGEHLFAVTAGLLRPQTYVSAGLRARLSDAHYLAVLEHEAEHVRRRHGLVKSLARLGAAFLPPGTRRALLEELELAMEQCCDEAAASAVGDRLTVAEAIVAASRLLRAPALSPAATNFGDGLVARRVESMLDGHWVRHGRVSLAAALAVAAIAIVSSHRTLHHALETLLTYGL